MKKWGLQEGRLSDKLPGTGVGQDWPQLFCLDSPWGARSFSDPKGIRQHGNQESLYRCQGVLYGEQRSGVALTGCTSSINTASESGLCSGIELLGFRKG